MTPAQQVALADFLFGMDCHTLYDLGPHLTCREADRWIELLVAFGPNDNAASLLGGHVQGDEDGDFHYEWTADDQRQELSDLAERFAESAVTNDEIVAGLQKIVEDVK